MRRRLAAVYTHPIQYNTPIFRNLAADPDVDLTVFYTSDSSLRGGLDREMGLNVTWDIPLLEGYRYEILSSIELPGSRGRWAWRLCPSLGSKLSRGNFDAVLIPGYAVPPYLHAIVSALLLRIPILLRGDSLDGTTNRRGLFKQAARGAFLRSLYRLSAGKLAIGSYMARHFRNMGVPDSQIFWSPHCVDNDFFARRAEQAGTVSAVRARHGLDACDVVALYCGKLVQRKGIRVLLDALNQQRAADRLGLIIVGEGELRPEIEAKLQTSKLGGYAMVGFKNQTELPEYYRAADILVLPSFIETWGLVVNEAMACGLAAIVSSGVGCARDLVIPRQTGWITPTGDAASLAGALDDAIENPEGTRQMGRNARAHIARYSPSIAAQGINAALKDAATRREFWAY